MKFPLLFFLMFGFLVCPATTTDKLPCDCCDTVVSVVCKKKAPWCPPCPVKPLPARDTVYIDRDMGCDTTIIYNTTVDCKDCCSPQDCCDGEDGGGKGHSKWFKILMDILDILKKLIGVLAAIVGFIKAWRELRKLNTAQNEVFSESRVLIVSKFTIWFSIGTFFLFLAYMPSFLEPLFRMAYVAIGGVFIGTISILAVCGAVYLLIRAVKSMPDTENRVQVNTNVFDDEVTPVERKRIDDKPDKREDNDTGRTLTILLLVAVLVMVGIQTVFLISIKFNTSVVINNHITVYSPLVWLIGGLFLFFIVIVLLFLVSRLGKKDELHSFDPTEKTYWQPVVVRPLIEIDWKLVAGILSFVAAELVTYSLVRQATCGIGWHQLLIPVLLFVLLIAFLFGYYRFVKPDYTSAFSKNLIIASKLLTQLQLVSADRRRPDMNAMFEYSAFISRLLTDEGYELQLTTQGRELFKRTMNIFGEIERRKKVDGYNTEGDKELELLVTYYTEYLSSFIKLYA